MDQQDLEHLTFFFETMSKRRKGFPSETQVKRGVGVVDGNKELVEKLGRNDLCPCGSAKRIKKCCRNTGCFRRRQPGPLLLGTDDHLPDLDSRAGFVVARNR
jgi:SEC-C motif